MANKDKQKMEELLRRPAGPGPAKYALPGTIGTRVRDLRYRRYPAFSFGQRWAIINGDCSPGPKYLVTRGPCAPGFSFYGRARETPQQLVPGPGHYIPERYQPPRERRAPSFSFGCRTYYVNREKKPGPNSYTMPVTIGPRVLNMNSAPAYSLNGRQKRGGFSEDLKKTPGPGSYNFVKPDIYQTKQPKYSLQGRNFMPGDPTIKPGPGVYSPHKLTKISAPAFSFGVKHSSYVVIPV